MEWFSVDKAGLAKLLERRGKAFAILELIQNCWDTNAATIDIRVEPITGRPLARVVVEDDDPEGFKDLTHAGAWEMRNRGRLHRARIPERREAMSDKPPTSEELKQAADFLNGLEYPFYLPEVVMRLATVREETVKAVVKAVVAKLRDEAASCRMNPDVDYPRDMSFDEMADEIERELLKGEKL